MVLQGQRFERPQAFDALEYLKTSLATLPRKYSLDVLLKTDLATAQREMFSEFGVLEAETHGVRLRSRVDDIDWAARELARLPIEFEVGAPEAMRRALRRLGRRLIGRSGRRGQCEVQAD